jgi:hypothetical protein
MDLKEFIEKAHKNIIRTGIGYKKGDTRMPKEKIDLENITFASKEEAMSVVNGMLGSIKRYGFATICDLYDLLGVTSNFEDTKYGWKKLDTTLLYEGSNGYTLDLPKPVDLRPTANDVVFANREDASTVLRQMNHYVCKYGCVTVQDFWELAGFTGSIVNYKYGWRNLKNVFVVHTFGGYKIALPEPALLDKEPVLAVDDNKDDNKDDTGIITINIPNTSDGSQHGILSKDAINKAYLDMIGKTVEHNGTQKRVVSIEFTEIEIVVKLRYEV